VIGSCVFHPVVWWMGSPLPIPVAGGIFEGIGWR